MKTTRRANLQVEPIESRLLLSAVPPISARVAREVSPSVFPPPLVLTGMARGTALVRTGIPDSGDMYTIRARGRLGPAGRLGQVHVGGIIQTTSQTGQPVGTVTISDRFGRADLRITGRPSTVGGTAQEYTFAVIRATGRFARLNGTDGFLELTAGPTGRGGRANVQLAINPVLIA